MDGRIDEGMGKQVDGWNNDRWKWMAGRREDGELMDRKVSRSVDVWLCE